MLSEPCSNTTVLLMLFFKEEALSITLSYSVKLYATSAQLSTGRAFIDVLFITARGLCAISSGPFHIANIYVFKSKSRKAAKVSEAQHIFMQVSESKLKSLNTELNLASYTKMFDSQLSHHEFTGNNVLKLWTTPSLNLKLDTYKHILLLFIDYINNALG